MKAIYRLFQFFIPCLLFVQMNESCNAQDRPEIKIGGLFSLSSYGKTWGLGEMRAAKMAVDEINAKGGIKGKKINFIVEDNQSDLKSTVAGFHKLLSVDNVAAVLGPNWLEFSKAVAPLANGRKRVTITSSGNAAALFSPDSYFFSLWPSESDQIKVLSEYVIQKKPASLVMLVSENGYYQEMCDAMEKQLEDAGIKVTSRHSFAPDAVDFRSILPKLKAQKIENVMLCLQHNGSLSAALQQSRDISFVPQFYGTDAVAIDDTLKKNPALAEGLVYFDYPVDRNSYFSKRFEAFYKEAPAPSSPFAYDAAYVIAEAIGNCAEIQNLRACLLSIEHEGVTGRIALNSDGTMKYPGNISKLFMWKKEEPIAISSPNAAL